MRISPFYSLLRGIALEDVWHDQDECPLGRSIRPTERRIGKGSSGKHCAFCELLHLPGPPLKRADKST